MLEDRYPEALGVECAWPAEWVALLFLRQPAESPAALAERPVHVELFRGDQRLAGR